MYYDLNNFRFVYNIIIPVAPVIRVTNQLVGAPLGTNVRLECYIESFPSSINYWLDVEGEMILQG